MRCTFIYALLVKNDGFHVIDTSYKFIMMNYIQIVMKINERYTTFKYYKLTMINENDQLKCIIVSR